MKKALIITNPQIFGGKPIIAGSRIAVSTILDLLAAGLTEKDIIKEYPSLTVDSLRAALSFASSRVKKESIVPVSLQDGRVRFTSV